MCCIRRPQAALSPPTRHYPRRSIASSACPPRRPFEGPCPSFHRFRCSTRDLRPARQWHGWVVAAGLGIPGKADGETAVRPRRAADPCSSFSLRQAVVWTHAVGSCIRIAHPDLGVCPVGGRSADGPECPQPCVPRIGSWTRSKAPRTSPEPPHLTARRPGTRRHSHQPVTTALDFFHGIPVWTGKARPSESPRGGGEGNGLRPDAFAMPPGRGRSRSPVPGTGDDGG